MAAADSANQARLDREAAREAARQKRMDELKAEREKRMAEKAAARAASDPMKNPTERPAAPQADDKYVYYYSWIGGVNSGNWKLYREPVGSPKADSAAARSTGGATQATFSSAVGANFVPKPTTSGSAVNGVSNSTGNTDSTAGFTMQGNVLYFNGQPFNGEKFGSNWVDGRPQGVADGIAQPSTTYTAPDGRIFTDLNAYNAYIAQQTADQKRAAGQSAYNLLFEEFNRYGLGSLVAPLQNFIVEGLSPAEFTIRLRDTDAYKKRFAANAARIQKGLTALDEATYIGLEDQYQEIMRKYGLPESYYSRGDMGRQEGFEKFIANDVAPTEVEDRIVTAQNRVINAAPEVSRALREFYPDITNGDILAYALDPQQAITNIKRKVTAAEIGGAAMAEGLATGLSRAEELARFGVTGAGYREAAPVIKQATERGSQLAGFYDQGVFDQATAEQAVLGISGSADAQKKIKKLTQLEQASFSGQAGAAGGALGRERAGQF